MIHARPAQTASLLLALSILLASGAPAPAAPRPLRIASWNLEWLVDAHTALAARIACRDGGPITLPCDVVRALPRNSADLARLAAYARELDADVVAFQEVENQHIARRVFRGYQICLRPGSGLQQVGFALRPGLTHHCGQPLTQLAVNARGRAGQPLTLEVPGLGTIELLAVHLKSGCAHDPLDSASDACRLLAAQASVLGQWIRQQATRQVRFIVLGDFNRGGPPRVSDPFWATLDPAAFVASSTLLPFANCSWGAPYREFIDHILVSRALVAALPEEPFRQLRYRPGDAARYLLSDHCPIGVSLNAPASL
jgi:endonuclease/exonuclease/phosphatase family metal-dependent hydrolase